MIRWAPPLLCAVLHLLLSVITAHARPAHTTARAAQMVPKRAREEASPNAADPSPDAARAAKEDVTAPSMESQLEGPPRSAPRSPRRNSVGGIRRRWMLRRAEAARLRQIRLARFEQRQ